MKHFLATNKIKEIATNKIRKTKKRILILIFFFFFLSSKDVRLIHFSLLICKPPWSTRDVGATCYTVLSKIPITAQFQRLVELMPRHIEAVLVARDSLKQYKFQLLLLILCLCAQQMRTLPQPHRTKKLELLLRNVSKTSPGKMKRLIQQLKHARRGNLSFILD